MTGRLAGIARKPFPKAAVEVVDRVHVGLATGVAGDFRGAIRPGKSSRRQVTLMMRSDWEAVLAELGVPVPWQERRANLLVEGLVLPRHSGARLRIGADVLLEVTGECDPCSRMETVATGLRAALTPDWRGGRLSRVLVEGDICIGDPIAVEEEL